MTASYVQSTDGVQVALHDFGGNGPALIIVHATGFHANCYAAIAEQLTDIRHVYAPDLRGHGDSTTPDIKLPWSMMADDVLAVLEHLDIHEPVDMVGHSMGGATVLATELRQPGAIRRAWVYEPIVFAPDPRRDKLAMSTAALRRRPTFDSLDDAYARYASRPPLNTADPRVLHDYVNHGFRALGTTGVTLKCTPENEARVFDGVDESTFGLLHKISAEITVVGSGDGGLPSLLAPKVAAEIGGATFVEWPDRTHFGPFEDPTRTAREIRAAIT